MQRFFQNQVLCKNRQQEIGGIRREIGGIRREIGGIRRDIGGTSRKRFQHVGVFVTFRLFFSRAAFFGLFGGNFCRRGLSAEYFGAGGSRYCHEQKHVGFMFSYCSHRLLIRESAALATLDRDTREHVYSIRRSNFRRCRDSRRGCSFRDSQKNCTTSKPLPPRENTHVFSNNNYLAPHVHSVGITRRQSKAFALLPLNLV